MCNAKQYNWNEIGTKGCKNAPLYYNEGVQIALLYFLERFEEKTIIKNQKR